MIKLPYNNMSQNFNLIKNGVIDFNSLILEKYANIGLNEVELVVLIKLNNAINSPNQTSLEKLPELLAETMQLTKEEIANVLVELIEEKYIDLKENKGLVTYDLNQTYQRLANILDDNEIEIEAMSKENDFKKIVNKIEKEFNIIVSPLDLEIIKHWINNDGYDYDKIDCAILECLKHKKYGVKYVNEFLRKNKAVIDTKVKEEDKEELQSLFNSVYGKIKNN